jgi:hypothetical protein
VKKAISICCILLLAKISFSQSTFRFIGNGYWTSASNWQNNLMPPESLQANDTIYISSAPADSCVLNKQQIILSGAVVVVDKDANLIIREGAFLTENPKLKKIIYSRDTITPLCSPPSYCPPTILQSEELFMYDNYNRIVKRLAVSTSQTDTFITTDTADEYNYFYNDNSYTIASYSHKGRYSDTITNHILQYDNLSRLITDSIMNPNPDNNKLTHFYYGADTIFENERQFYPAGTQYRIDTLLFSANNIYQVNRSLMAWKHTYNFSYYRNPLSYVNNFSLMASDRKNAGMSDIFMIYNPEFITYNQVNEDRIQYISSGQLVQYINTFTITTDIFNRVVTISNTAGNNRATTFVYY